MSGHGGGGGDSPKAAGNKTPKSGRTVKKPPKDVPWRRNQNSKVDLSKVPRDANGGVLVLEEDVESAFKFLDVKQMGKVTLQALKQRFGAFYNSMPVQRIKNMMEGKHNFNLDQMKELVIDNGMTDFDPVAEAFKVYDRENLGCLTSSTLRDLFGEADIRELDDEDLQILIESCDMDKDGQIGLEDFRLLGQVAGGGAANLLKTKGGRTGGLRKTGVGPNGLPAVSFHQTLMNLMALADGDFTVLTKENFMDSMLVVQDSALMELLRKEVLCDAIVLRELLRMTVQERFHQKRSHRPRSAMVAQQEEEDDDDDDGARDNLKALLTTRNQTTPFTPGRRRQPQPQPLHQPPPQQLQATKETARLPVTLAPPPLSVSQNEMDTLIAAIPLDKADSTANLEHLLEASLQKGGSRRPSMVGDSNHRGRRPSSAHRPSTSGGPSMKPPMMEMHNSMTDSQRLLELLGTSSVNPFSLSQSSRRLSTGSIGSNRRRSSMSGPLADTAPAPHMLREAGETMALLSLLENSTSCGLMSSNSAFRDSNLDDEPAQRLRSGSGVMRGNTTNNR